MTEVVGREAALASIRAFVATIADSAAALVLEGEAGMGKTTLWRAAVEHADRSGVLVLEAQPVESETTLSFAGLGDLLDPVLDRVLGELPPVRQRALTRALALGDDDQPDLDPRALRVAVMGAIRTLAEEEHDLARLSRLQIDRSLERGARIESRAERIRKLRPIERRRMDRRSVPAQELGPVTRR